MFVAAVTGTNGKTSVVEAARQLCDATGLSAASFGSLGLVSPAGRERHPELTVGQMAVPVLLERLRAEGVRACFVEAYAGSIRFKAYDTVLFDAALFTHLSPDHLDVFATTAEYRAAKTRLFTWVLRHGTAVVGTGSHERHVARAARRAGHRVIRYSGRHVARGMPAGWFDHELDNIAGGAVLARLAGAEPDAVRAALPTVARPPGRMTRLRSRSGAEVVVDFAHNPGGVETVLRALRRRTIGELTAVLGCGGDRDPTKRPTMGRLADRWADRVVVTDDEARSEDPAAIRAQVMAGAPDAAEIADRNEAVAHAVATAAAGDTVAVLGMGESDLDLPALSAVTTAGGER